MRNVGSAKVTITFQSGTIGSGGSGWGTGLISPNIGSVPLYGRRQCLVAGLFHKVMLADRGHGACLRALDAFILCNHEPDFVADLKLVEVTVNHAVFVEIDLLAVRGLGKPIILKELRDLAMTGRGMDFYRPAHAPRMVFQLSTRRIEGIANGDINVLMRMVERARMPDEDILPRHTDVDPHVIKLAVVMMTMRGLDDNSAPHNAIVKALELSGFLANSSLHRWRRFHPMKTDLQGHLHRTIHYFSRVPSTRVK